MEKNRQIAKAIAQSADVPLSKLGLRFDKVVRRLLGNIASAIEPGIPRHTVVILTITAPVKQSSKTADELISKIRASLRANGSISEQAAFVLHENSIQLRFHQAASIQSVMFIGFVHNWIIDPNFLFELTLRWLA